MKRYSRILLTGAGGALGSVLRPALAGTCDVLRVADRVDVGPTRGGEEIVVADLADRDAVFAMVRGVDAIVHFGGQMAEDWDSLLSANVVGLYHLYDAAERHGVKRVVYASSNHATGFYGTDEVIGPTSPVRPDTLYGLTKTWGENIARLYFDRYGIETACLRIGSAFAEPKNLRMLATWLSYDDLIALVKACLAAPRVGHTVVYGVSDNPGRFWDNTPASHLGFRPKDSSERFRQQLEERLAPLDPESDDAKFQGGSFVRA